jgi:hypothetical protein
MTPSPGTIIVGADIVIGCAFIRIPVCPARKCRGPSCCIHLANRWSNIWRATPPLRNSSIFFNVEVSSVGRDGVQWRTGGRSRLIAPHGGRLTGLAHTPYLLCGWAGDLSTIGRSQRLVRNQTPYAAKRVLVSASAFPAVRSGSILPMPASISLRRFAPATQSRRGVVARFSATRGQSTATHDRREWTHADNRYRHSGQNQERLHQIL